MKVSRAWLQTFFETPLPEAKDLEHALTFGAFEIEGVEKTGDDAILDVKVLPNRAHDCLSHRGIAKEISVLCNIPMSRDPLSGDAPTFPESATLSVSVEDSEACPVYQAAYITGVTVGPSPAWLRERLEGLGQRSISNVVDATNFVMLELGQPLHAFDAGKLGDAEGVKAIGVRMAREGEMIEILGGTTYELNRNIQLITDASSDTPLALAGIKGGNRAEVDAQTTNLVLESAKFHPTLTRKASQFLKLRTDASYRFENEIPDDVPSYALGVLTKLILEIAGGEVVGYASHKRPAQALPEIEISTVQINKVLGTTLKDAVVEDILKRLGFSLQKKGESYVVVPPFERIDVTLPADVVEEVGRVYGYENIESAQLPALSVAPEDNPLFCAAETIRKTLGELGWTEVYTYTLREAGNIKLANALASDKAFLRSSLVPGIMEALAMNEHNAPLLGLSDIKIFEIGNVFDDHGEHIEACLGVRLASPAKKSARSNAVLLEAKEKLQETLGGQLDERIEEETLTFDLGALVEGRSFTCPEFSPVADGIQYTSPSQYPFVLRDIAVWVPDGEGTGNDVIAVVKKYGGALLVRIDMFDMFSKDGKTSYAYHLVFQSNEKTLSDADINPLMQKITDDLNGRDGWQVR